MSEQISSFFDAWAIEDERARNEKIASVLSDHAQYDDPRTPDTLVGIKAVSDYVGRFAASAPGWSANVIKEDTTAGKHRVTVAFGGLGPDGNAVVQHGQYFVELDGDLITRMVGFVGTGQLE
jgi:hypothetical protein